MRRIYIIGATLIVAGLLLNACVPLTYSPPTEIYLNPGDQVKQAVIAVDNEGRSHIAGVANDRIIYYRTRFGEKLTAFEMTMTGSGANWKQYNPDIAVLDSGRAIVTWVEQRGGTDKYACQQQIPILVPIGGFDKDCDPLDGNEKTVGNVWVTARGETAYAVYDRPAGNGRTADLWYQQLAGGAAIGRVDWFFGELKTAELYSLDLGIDDGGFLHVGYHYNWTINGTPPFAERMELRSNRTTQPDGKMSQIWLIFEGFFIEYTPLSLSFYQDGATQRVALAFGSYYQVFVQSCSVIGCASQAYDEVAWPVSWWTNSMVSEVEILGIDNNLHVGFIGNSNSTPISTDQVYRKVNAFDASNAEQVSSGSAMSKYSLELTRVNARPNSAAAYFAVIAWGETDQSVNEFFVYDGILNRIKVYSTDCAVNLPKGVIGSNGFYVSGVWDDCSNTIFTTQAWNTQLPLITK